MNQGIRILLKFAGILSVGLGILGIFLPLLPTTPFLLLAAACFTRSSPRFYEWLINHRHLGEYVRNYRERRAIKFQIIATLLALLWLTLGTSILVFDALWLRSLLAAIGVGVTIHLLSLRTIRA